MSDSMETGSPVKNKLKTFVDHSKLQADLAFSEHQLSEAFTTQAALFAHYASQAHKAQYQADRTKSQADMVEARLNAEYRGGFKERSEKATEKQIDALVREDRRFIAAHQRAHEAQLIASLCKTAVESFRHRKDMLVQSGADAREERKGELRMNGSSGHRESVTSRMIDKASGRG